MKPVGSGPGEAATPLLIAYAPEKGGFACILGVTLTMLVLGRALENWRTSSTHVPAQLETRSWPGERSIGVSGPAFNDAFTNWAPRAVLERLPAPRALLIRLPAPRVELVRLPNKPSEH